MFARPCQQRLRRSVPRLRQNVISTGWSPDRDLIHVVTETHRKLQGNGWDRSDKPLRNTVCLMCTTLHARFYSCDNYFCSVILQLIVSLYWPLSVVGYLNVVGSWLVLVLCPSTCLQTLGNPALFPNYGCYASSHSWLQLCQLSIHQNACQN